MVKKKDRFYSDGLEFGCTGCGHCCKLDDGKVFVSKSDLPDISDYLDMTEEQVIKKYINGELNNQFILEDGDAGNCIFLKNNRCIIYPVRPIQCKTFPFWPENIKSLYRWKIIAEECSGIGRGRLFSVKEINLISENKATVEILINGDKDE